MKIKLMIMLTVAIVIISATPIYAGRRKVYSTGKSIKTVSGQKAGYGSKNTYDEFHTAPTDIPANDNYRSGSFDELHINENYSQVVWHPEDRGMRINGFDEFHFADEL